MVVVLLAATGCGVCLLTALPAGFLVVTGQGHRITAGDDEQANASAGGILTQWEATSPEALRDGNGGGAGARRGYDSGSQSGGSTQIDHSPPLPYFSVYEAIRGQGGGACMTGLVPYISIADPNSSPTSGQ